MNRTGVLAWLVAATLALAGCGASATPSQSPSAPAAAPAQPVPLTLAFDWVPVANDAPVYRALLDGAFRAAGIDLEVSRGTGSGNTLNRVATGSVDVGQVDSGVLVAALAKNPDLGVKAIGLMYQEAPSVVIYREDTGIRAPKDLAGHSISVVAGSGSSKLVEPFLRRIGVDPASVKVVNADVNTRNTLLLQKKVDSVLGFANDIVTMAAPAREAGVTLRAFRLADYGLHGYGTAYVARDATIRDKAPQLRAFLKVMYQAWAEATADPAGAAEAFVHYNTADDVHVIQTSLEQAVLPFVATAGTQEGGLGYMTSQGWQETVDLVALQQTLGSRPPLESLYTTQLFTPVPPRKVWG